MGKSSGGVRGGGGKMFPVRESERAMMFNVEYAVEYAPSAAFTSSMVRDKFGKTTVWIPKSQIEGNAISNWIYNTKAFEIAESAVGGYVVNHNVRILDAKGNQVKVGTKTDARKEREREKRRNAAYKEASKKREKLIQAAKANGFKAHSRMRTKTLEKMANGTYLSRAEREERRIAVRREILKTRQTKR